MSNAKTDESIKKVYVEIKGKKWRYYKKPNRKEPFDGKIEVSEETDLVFILDSKYEWSEDAVSIVKVPDSFGEPEVKDDTLTIRDFDKEPGSRERDSDTYRYTLHATRKKNGKEVISDPRIINKRGG